MRKCIICKNALQYPFLANYEQGKFVCVECVKERKEEVAKETKNWKDNEISKTKRI